MNPSLKAPFNATLSPALSRTLGRTLSATEGAHHLLNAAAVRQAAHQMLARLKAGEGAWCFNESRLEVAADQIVATTRLRYPTLDIPYHSRWRHFEAGGVNRRQSLANKLFGLGADAAERARVEIDLAVVSVLLDAGSGPDWKYVDHAPPGPQSYTRSEGLGVASFRMFERGAFSSDRARPFQADALGLKNLTSKDIASGFQVSPDNPLVGIEGRTTLLNRLGEQLLLRADMFLTTQDSESELGVVNSASKVGQEALFRPGALFDYLRGQECSLSIRADAILEALLEGLGGMWLTGNTLAGTALGDCWPYRLADGSATWVPFHKLSQWLTYSLLEAFEAAGTHVTDLDALTGLPEYRNGGLLMDTGVLTLKDATLAEQALEVSHPVIIEWRAATVALLDLLAPIVKAKLGIPDDQALPLAKVLEGGSWAAGRKTAQMLRGGLPPLNIVSDGTVF